MQKSKQALLVSSVVMVLLLAPSLAFAQDPATEPTISVGATDYLTLVAFIVGGLTWSFGGYIDAHRKDPKTKFDYGKLKNQLFIGMMVGIVAFGISIAQGDKFEAIDITNPASFILSFGAAVVGAGGTLALIQKYILRGLLSGVIKT